MTALFENAQWRVTSEGLEHVSGSLLITPDMLVDRPEDQRVLTWHLIMRAKSSVDMPAFFEAFRKAVALLNLPIDPADIALSERVALRVHARAEAWAKR